MLRYTEEIIRTVNHYELERFILEETGRELTLQAALECANDTEHSFVVAPDDNIGEYDQDTINTFLREGDYSYNTVEWILIHLCNERRLEAGTYLVSLSY